MERLFFCLTLFYCSFLTFQESSGRIGWWKTFVWFLVVFWYSGVPLFCRCDLITSAYIMWKVLAHQYLRQGRCLGSNCWNDQQVVCRAPAGSEILFSLPMEILIFLEELVSILDSCPAHEHEQPVRSLQKARPTQPAHLLKKSRSP